MILRKGIYTINGVDRMVVSDIENETLAQVLRRIGLTSIKIGCGVGQCGTCTVLLDGSPVRACTKRFKNIPEYSKIETLEGLGTASNLHPLQLAWMKYGGVQCGFCTPGFIMSAKGLLDVNPKPTRQDVRDWFTKNNNLCRCTGYKQLVDAVMAAAEVMRGEKTKDSLFFEMPGDKRVYNSHHPRPAALGKVLGVTDYGDDIDIKMPPGTLHVAVKFSDEIHADILSIDTSEAEAMPGVKKVILAKDVPGPNDMGLPIGHLRSMARNIHKPIICNTRVTHLGAIVALVVADTRNNARAAAAKIMVEYEKLPVYNTYLEACLPDSIPVLEDYPTPFVYQPVIKGDSTAEIFEKAKDPNSGITVVEGSFASSRQPHLALETETAQAFYDENGKLTIACRSQGPHMHQLVVSMMLGIDKNDLRIIESPTGASFGAAMSPETMLIIGIAAMIMKQPVTYTSNFREKQRLTGKRPASFANTRLACDSEGHFLAHEFDIALDYGASTFAAEGNFTKTARFALANYKNHNIRGLVRGGFSNNSIATAYRGNGAPEAYTSGEPLIDMMARKLGIDPFEMRYRNIVEEGDTTINGGPYRYYVLKDMMDKMRADYEDALKWKAEPATPGWKRGVGICVGGYHVSTPIDISEVGIEICPDGRFTYYNAWADQGQGADIGSIVLIHEALRPLEVPVDKIRLVMNDTKMCPNTGVAAGSRSHFMSGNAAKLAVEKLMNAMRKEDGTYRTYEEMVADGLPTRYDAQYSTVSYGRAQISVDDGQGDPIMDQNFIINIARLEVEEATGKVKIFAIHSMADVGIVGNYLVLDGQAYGGLFHSIGFALSEDYSDDGKKYETPFGCGFLKCNEVPDDMTYEYQETPRPHGPFGSGGASECFQSVSHVCVLNAINDAVGVYIYEIPATPGKVKTAMGVKAAGKDYAPAKYYLGRDFYEVLEEIQANPVQPKGPVEISEMEIARGGH